METSFLGAFKRCVDRAVRDMISDGTRQVCLMVGLGISKIFCNLDDSMILFYSTFMGKGRWKMSERTVCPKDRLFSPG